MVAHTENAVRRFGFAEDNRYACILDTGQYRRRFGDIRCTVAAEGNGAEVILLLHRVALAIESDILDPSGIHHRFGARSGVVVRTVGVERAEVHPSVIGLLAEFVLELDMVEVRVLDVVAIDHDRLVPTRRVFGRERVHHPFIVRRRDVHIAADRRVMYAKRCFMEVQDVALRSEHQRQVLEVVSLTGIYLEGLVDGLTRVELDSPAVTRQRESVHQHFGSVRVRSIDEHKFEDYVVFKALLCLVAKPDLDDRRLVTRYVAYLMIENIDLRVLQLQRTVRQLCRPSALLVEDGLFRSFPRTLGGTAVEFVDERSVEVRITVVVITVVHGFADIVGGLVEMLVLIFPPEHGHVHIRVLIGFEYETGGTGMGL